MIDYGLDTHKLMLHPKRVSEWLEGGNPAPIIVEICPIGRCNHRCVFCAYNYTDYKGPALNTETVMSMLSDMGRIGVKAIDWDTEGEPLLHPNLPDFINHAKYMGIDSAVETNGVLLTKDFVERCGENISYIKVSVDASCNETHHKLHRGGRKDFDKVIKNIAEAVSLHTGCVIGMQMVLFKENEDEVAELARIARDIGVDWLAIKPFSLHPFQDGSLVHMGDINKVLGIPDITVRRDTFNRVFKERDYPICYGVNFISNVDCYGNVTICNTLTRKDEYTLGNVYLEPFSKIWERHPKSFDIKECKREVCRMDKQNLYLWQLKNPPPHINFI
jgi:MoaA/NifB/PqqE/SkfB family radical SAM enzyme